MHIVVKLLVGTALLAAATTSALAQNGQRPGDPPLATYNDPPGALPNPLNIVIHKKDDVFPQNRVFGNRPSRVCMVRSPSGNPAISAVRTFMKPTGLFMWFPAPGG